MRRTAIPFVVACLLAPLLRPLQDEPSAPARPDAGSAAQQALADTLDAQLAAIWKEQSLRVAPPADDATWLRRLSVDLCGVIPAREEVAAFLADGAADKRARKIDQYLSDRRFAETLSYLWCNLLLAEAAKDGDRTRPWLRTWLEEEIARDAHMTGITRRLIAARESAKTPGATAYVLTYRDSLESLTGITARAFLGLQIQCSQCHDDRNGKWKQTDFIGFTGFFADLYVDHVKDRENGGGKFRIQDLELSSMRSGAAPAGEMDPADEPGMSPDAPPMADTKPGEAGAVDDAISPDEMREFLAMKFAEGKPERVDKILNDPKQIARMLESPGAREALAKIRRRRAQFGEPSYPGGEPYVATPGETKREALAAWITAPDNPWFARAIANRMWAHLFGAGLVEPVDDLSGANDPTFAATLDGLAKAFSERDADLRFLVGAIVRTRAYALASPLADDPLTVAREQLAFSVHAMRPFTAEQVANSLLRLHGKGEAPGSLTARQEKTSGRAELVAALRRSFGELNGSGKGGTSPGIPQALFLMNGEYSLPPASLTQGEAATQLADPARAPIVRLQPLFFALLARPPTPAEAERMIDLLGDAREEPAAAAGRVYWALLNSTEFHTQH